MSRSRSRLSMQSVRCGLALSLLGVSTVVLIGCGNQLAGTFLGGFFGGGGGGGLAVSSAPYPVRVGDQIQFTTTGEGQNIVWRSSCDPGSGSINNSGVFTATQQGICTVWATYQTIPSDPNIAPQSATSNRVTFEVWARGPSLGNS